MSKKLRKRFCPSCNHQLDAVTAISGDDVKPRKGDLTICIECLEILQFDKNIRPVALKGDTLTALPNDVFNDLTKARAMLVKIKKVHLWL